MPTKPPRSLVLFVFVINCFYAMAQAQDLSGLSTQACIKLLPNKAPGNHGKGVYIKESGCYIRPTGSFITTKQTMPVAHLTEQGARTPEQHEAFNNRLLAQRTQKNDQERRAQATRELRERRKQEAERARIAKLNQKGYWTNQLPPCATGTNNCGKPLKVRSCWYIRPSERRYWPGEKDICNLTGWKEQVFVPGQDTIRDTFINRSDRRLYPPKLKLDYACYTGEDLKACLRGKPQNKRRRQTTSS